MIRHKFFIILGSNSKILATGGASQNSIILQTLSNVFNLPVFILPATSNSTCLGCIYRCKQAALGGTKDDFFKAVKHLPPPSLLCQPNEKEVVVYDNLVRKYKLFEESIVKNIE